MDDLNMVNRRALDPGQVGNRMAGARLHARQSSTGSTPATNITMTPPTYDASPVHGRPLSQEAMVAAVKKHAASREWRAVLRITQQTMQRKCTSAEMVQMRLCRAVAHIQMKQPKLAGEELEAMREAQQGDGGAQHGSKAIPFAARLLRAELPALQNNVSLSIDFLHNLLEACRTEIKRGVAAKKGQEATLVGCVDLEGEGEGELRVSAGRSLLSASDVAYMGSAGLCLWYLQPPSAEGDDLFTVNDFLEGKTAPDTVNAWRKRETSVLICIIAKFLVLREYGNALVMLRDLRKMYPNDITLLCGILRVYMQLGNTVQAEKCLRDATELAGVEPSGEDWVQLQMSKGFLSLAADDYGGAISHFDAILSRVPTNFIAANNRAIALLLSCRLGDAISSLEDMLRSSPEKFVNEQLVFNLCTMYDLQSDSSVEKKKYIMGLVQKYGGDGFDVSVVKMPPS